MADTLAAVCARRCAVNPRTQTLACLFWTTYRTPGDAQKVQTAAAASAIKPPVLDAVPLPSHTAAP
ncbi:hypothetical protein WAE61_01480 [Comamonadaceae bacterium PP-2]